MEGTGKWEKASFLTILWVILVVLLYALPCRAYDGILTVGSSDIVDLGIEYGQDYVGVNNGWADVYGTLNMYPGAYVDWGIYSYSGSTVNIYAGTIGAGYWIQVDDGATVTVYGTGFVGTQGGNVDGNLFTTSTEPDSPYYGTGVLQGTYGNGDPINLLFNSQVPIYLSAPGTTNEPPVITEITIDPIPLDSPTTVTAMFTDADGGTHTAAIVWEEGGTPESGVVDETEMTVTGSHTYTATGVYTVTVTVTDQNGGTASRTAYAAVYDPHTCNLVTGAGWFPEEQSPCGQALFGFIVRQWGSYPAGLMYFRWGNNQFQATEVDWLVISDDENSAWFFGVGSINGMGEYYFMVEISENPGSIWVTIWDEYDNGGLTELTGGRIRICQWGG